MHLNYIETKVDFTKSLVFKDFFHKYYVPLCVFANKYIRDPEIASDIVQDSFVSFWEKRSDFNCEKQTRSYLYTTIRNKCLNELDHLKVVGAHAQKQRDHLKESFFKDVVLETESHRILVESINKLPTQSRKVMLLALDGLSNKEIGEVLNISKETVHSLKKIAYRKLKVYLKDYYYLLFLFIPNS